MTQSTVYASWAGPRLALPAPRPSWLAPRPAPSEDGSDEAVQVTIPPGEVARLYPTLPPPREEPIVSEPPPPPYPDLRAEHAALSAQLAAALEAMSHLRRRVLEASEPGLVALACAVGEKIAGHELRADPSLVVAWAREGILQLAKEESLVVAISTDVAASLDDAAWAPALSASVRVTTDPALPPRSCEVRGPNTTVDESLAQRADSVRREVTGASR
jgi:hypothetical protein